MEFFAQQYILDRVMHLAGGPLWTTGLRSSCRAARNLLPAPDKYADEEDLLLISAGRGDYGGCEFALAHGAINYLDAMNQAAAHGHYAVFKRLSHPAPCSNDKVRLLRMFYYSLYGGNLSIITAAITLVNCDESALLTVMHWIILNDFAAGPGLIHCTNILDKYGTDHSTKPQTAAYIARMYLFLYGYTGEESYAARADAIIQSRSVGMHDSMGYYYRYEPGEEKLQDYVLIGAAYAGCGDRRAGARSRGVSSVVPYVVMGVASLYNGDLEMLEQAYKWLGQVDSSWLFTAFSLGNVKMMQWIADHYDTKCTYYPTPDDTWYGPGGEGDRKKCFEMLHKIAGIAREEFLYYYLLHAVDVLDYELCKLLIANSAVDFDEMCSVAMFAGNTGAYKLAIKMGGHAVWSKEEALKHRNAPGFYDNYLMRPEVFDAKIIKLL